MWTRFDLADHKTFHYTALNGSPLGVETEGDHDADALKAAALRTREEELQAALAEVQVALGQVPTLQHYTVVGIFTDNDQAFVDFYSASSPQEALERAETQNDDLVVVHVCVGIHYGLVGARFRPRRPRSCLRRPLARRAATRCRAPC